MRAIKKGREPPSLTAHRQAPHGDYGNYRDKDAPREALAIEQRGLCCYCMGRIRPSASDMKIEHWRCQARYPDKQLNYSNLLGTCLGGEGQPPHSQHCDTRKGDDDLRWNPADSAHVIEARLQYDPDGTIRSNDPIFDTQLNRTLNLNLPFLRNNRKNVLDSLLHWWSGRPKPVSRGQIERRRKKYIAGNGELTPLLPSRGLVAAEETRRI